MSTQNYLFKPVLLDNKIPPYHNHDEAVMRRCKIIEFNYKWLPQGEVDQPPAKRHRRDRIWAD